MKLGDYPALSLAGAHEAHAAARKIISAGLDPIVERDRIARVRALQEEKARVLDGVTVRNVIAEWSWHHARRNRKKPREAVRLLKTHLCGHLKAKPAQQITKRDLVQIIDKVIARNAGVMANRLRDLIAQVFAFAAARDLIPSSPAAGLLKRPGGEEKPKERFLSPRDIRALWQALDSAETRMSRQVRLALKLILVTAQRPGEVANAKLENIDLHEHVWTIPGDTAKNGLEHRVPLTELAISLIRELRELSGNEVYLLPSAHTIVKANKPLSVRALSRALRNNYVVAKQVTTLFGIAPFTPHDLRRTAATLMTGMGITRLHVKKILNHSDKEDVTAVYDKHTYWPEKVRAMSLWSSELQSILISPESNVIHLAGSRGYAVNRR